ncbi:MAG: grasp-with-spasm system SPASM domain peptide maturase [Bacteroidia bacterium]
MSLKSKKSFLLYASTMPVSGAHQAAIYDLQRQDVFPIPNDLYKLIEKQNEGVLWGSIVESYDRENVDTINEYIEFLIKHELGWWVGEEEKNRFPLLDLSWDYPGQITNALVEVGFPSVFNLKKAIQQITFLGGRDIQIQIKNTPTITQLEQVIAEISTLNVRSIELVVEYCPAFKVEQYSILKQKNVSVFFLKVCGIPSAISKLSFKEENMFFTTKSIEEISKDHTIHPSAFSVNIPTFTEAQNHNLYFNRKLSIDAEGFIKNCPSHAHHFGNIADTKLEAAIEKPGFKDYWFITKDQIDGCKDCEFRYMCVDPATPVDNGKGGWKRPEPCAYDPYTATWKEDIALVNE